MQPSTDSLSTSEKLVELTGGDLTVEDVVAVARDGARVRVSDEALRHRMKPDLPRDQVEELALTEQVPDRVRPASGGPADEDGPARFVCTSHRGRTLEAAS